MFFEITAQSIIKSVNYIKKLDFGVTSTVLIRPTFVDYTESVIFGFVFLDVTKIFTFSTNLSSTGFCFKVIP